MKNIQKHKIYLKTRKITFFDIILRKKNNTNQLYVFLLRLMIIVFNYFLTKK